MKKAARAAMIIAPLTAASVFATAGPAFAGGSPDSCIWPGTGGVQAVAVGLGTSVVVNGFQFTCDSPSGTSGNATWHPDGTTDAPNTPYLQSNYDPNFDPSKFSEGVVLVDANGEAMQDYVTFWNDGGPWSDYSEYGSVDGGGSGGFGGLQP
jgi:hypothetical protein